LINFRFTNEISIHLQIRDAKGLAISNALGQKVYERNLEEELSVNVDLNGFGSGIYFIKVYNTNGRVIGVKKIVKQ